MILHPLLRDIDLATRCFSCLLYKSVKQNKPLARVREIEHPNLSYGVDYPQFSQFTPYLLRIRLFQQNMPSREKVNKPEYLRLRSDGQSINKFSNRVSSSRIPVTFYHSVHSGLIITYMLFTGKGKFRNPGDTRGQTYFMIEQGLVCLNETDDVLHTL
jgi:hypothetical protein